jgi:hypothetical protein
LQRAYDNISGASAKDDIAVGGTTKDVAPGAWDFSFDDIFFTIFVS